MRYATICFTLATQRKLHRNVWRIGCNRPLAPASLTRGAPRREHLMADLTDRFGTMVFSEDVMKKWLPKDVYKKLAATIEEGQPLDLDVANAVAHAMKEWAIAHGATHYAHWFQPLSGITSEKHDSFLEPNHDGTAITKFSGKALIKASPTLRASPTAACVPPSRRVAIPHGTPRARRSSRTTSCASPRRFAPTRARRWIRRPRCCAP